MRRQSYRTNTASHSDAETLQRPRSSGRAVARTQSAHFAHNFSGVPLQAKLKVGSAGDAYERQADRVAEEVMRAPEPRIQRKCGCGGSCGDCKSGSSSDDEVHRLLQRKSVSGEDVHVAPENVEGVLRQAGAPLDATTRSFMEPRFGHNFTNVRVHSGAEAAEAADSVGARAYTVGRHIVFGAGEYRPGTADGQRLLAHELTHVTQQKGGNDSRVQRTMTLADPGLVAPQPPGAMGPAPTRAIEFQTWLNELCSAGTFVVNPTTGVVASTSRATFCGAATSRGRAHHTTSATPAGCQCLCTATATGAGSKTIEVQIAENLTISSGPHTGTLALSTTGGAATAHIGANDKIIASRGFGFGSASTPTGAGDTSPRAAGTGVRNQVLRNPAWLVFGHELCGHALPQAAVTREEHFMTPQGNQSAIDAENQLRQEHSTSTDNLGTRHGTFRAMNAAGTETGHQGAVYSVVASETVATIATRVGIAPATTVDHIWRFNGARLTATATVTVGEQLLIEGIDWYTARAGDTMAKLATTWSVPLASLQRANPQIAGPAFTIRAGDRLLIPVS
jgi:LysM repeat protein